MTTESAYRPVVYPTPANPHREFVHPDWPQVLVREYSPVDPRSAIAIRLIHPNKGARWFVSVTPAIGAKGGAA
jgi:hypothetical protein